ncbi:Mediator of RNA polymerase II transcription subunit 10b, partial [Cucurbita argyrosperma subsp. sororia]
MDSAQNASSAAGTGGSGGNGSVINDTSASTTVDDSKQNLNQVINSIQKTLGILHQLNLTVSNFNAAYQLPLLQRLNSLVLELDNMVKLSEKCTIQVPMEVVNLIDDGKNPDEFTRDVLNSCIAKNQSTKGKTDAFKGLRKHLLEELEQTFPDEVESYREIRAASAAESKRIAQSQMLSALIIREFVLILYPIKLKRPFQDRFFSLEIGFEVVAIHQLISGRPGPSSGACFESNFRFLPYPHARLRNVHPVKCLVCSAYAHASIASRKDSSNVENYRFNEVRKEANEEIKRRKSDLMKSGKRGDEKGSFNSHGAQRQMRG